MGFICIVCCAIELIWCFLVPVIGSLYLISSKYHSKNEDKTILWKHWVYFWISFIMLKLSFSMISFLPGFLLGILNLVRILLLSLMVSPKLNLTVNGFEFVLAKGKLVKDFLAQMVSEKITLQKKTN